MKSQGAGKPCKAERVIEVTRRFAQACRMLAQPLRLSLALGLFALSIFAGSARAETLHVAVASNFVAAMTDITKLYEQRSGHQVRISPGASGKLYAQILNGAPFQLFFSADQEKPRALEQQGIGIAGSRHTYAQGRLVLWALRDDLELDQGTALGGQNWRRLAMANPRHAPYGIAASEVLNHLGVTEKVRRRLVLGENIAQTYQFIASGNADLGFIALSQTLQDARPLRGQHWIIPADWHNPIRQDVILIEETPAARALLAFIKTAPAAAILQRYGYHSAALRD